MRYDGPLDYRSDCCAGPQLGYDLFVVPILPFGRWCLIGWSFDFLRLTKLGFYGEVLRCGMPVYMKRIIGDNSLVQVKCVYTLYIFDKMLRGRIFIIY